MSCTKRCRSSPSDDDEYPSSAPNYQSAPMKLLVHAARRDLYRQTGPGLSIQTESKTCPTELVALQLSRSKTYDLDEKCYKLAQLIANAKHLVAFTGAGISTSVGIPDYRGEDGLRTKKCMNVKSQRTKKPRIINTHQYQIDETSDDYDRTNMNSTDIIIPELNSLVPSSTHMALYELYQLGLLKHIVSQNVDNLHLKSGIPATALTEVHGNATQAKCETCEKIYVTDFPWTGLCTDPECLSTKRPVEQRLRARTRHGNGRLKRNVVGFDEPLGDIDFAIDECEVADVAFVLGTSLRVEPFTEMAGTYAGSLCIVNLQSTTTKLDRQAEETGVRVFEKTDVVMEKTMQFLLNDLTYRVPKWTGEHSKSIFVLEHESSNLVNVLAGRIKS